MYTPFLTDLINNMDHMRIAGTEPSSEILTKQNNLKIQFQVYNNQSANEYFVYSMTLIYCMPRYPHCGNLGVRYRI